MGTYKRGMVVVVGDECAVSGKGGGFSTMRLATVTSISRDGSAVRAIRRAGSGTVEKITPYHRCLFGPLPDADPAVVDSFTYPHTYPAPDGTEVTYRYGVTVFGAAGIEGMREAARYLRNCVDQWADNGTVPVGHNPEHPESVHMGRPSTPESRQAAAAMLATT